MRVINNRRGQSTLEFAFIIPLFLFFTLGIIQLGIIFINSLMVKYAAYITARTAVAYEEDRMGDKAAEARDIACNMITGTNSSSLQAALKNFMVQRITGLNSSQKVTVKKIQVKGIKKEFIEVTVCYDMPLQVPVVNKFFGMIKGGIEKRIFSFTGSPLYMIKAESIMELTP